MKSQQALEDSVWAAFNRNEITFTEVLLRLNNIQWYFLNGASK